MAEDKEFLVQVVETQSLWYSVEAETMDEARDKALSGDTSYSFEEWVLDREIRRVQEAE